MAYDQPLAERVRGLLADESVEEKSMFGGLAFLLGGHMSVSASGQGGLLVGVDPADTEALLHEPGAQEFEMGKRGLIKGWLRVDLGVLGDDDALLAWVNRGVAYARSLPAK